MTNIQQKTLRKPVTGNGVGVHSGLEIFITLKPAPIGSGIVFIRTDVKDKNPVVEAKWNKVFDTRLCTVIANEDGVSVGTIEHLMSAIVGTGIDNMVIEISGAEVPIMDGSAEPFMFLIECAGTVTQDAPKRALKINKEVTYQDGDKSITLSPSPVTNFSFDIDFDHKTIGQQSYSVSMINGTYKNDISRARTFGFLHEVEQLQKMGLARGGSLDNAVVVNDDGVMNEGGLRYNDEFVRHKILDAIGDIYLGGAVLLGNYHGVKAGHSLNNQVLHKLFADKSNYEFVNLPMDIPQIKPQSVKTREFALA